MIRGCELLGKDGFSATAGVQLKGGCSNVVVEKCRFVDAGMRALNIGGSTGMEFFRPAKAKYEAREIIVRNNTIEGSECAAAFVGVDVATFSNNNILNPKKWIFRILQETRAEGFPPCRKVSVVSNSILFRRADVNTEINIGDATEPESFYFEKNHWYATDNPDRSRPTLPVAEKEGRYGP